jgi:hypothetical protein
MIRYSTTSLIAVIILLSCQGEDGQPGLNSLIGVAEEGPGIHCENGGFKLQSGLDKNRNGALNPDEVETTNFVCNGSTGPAGSNGTNGANGSNGAPYICDMIPESVNDDCPNGGLRVIAGLDLNGDGQLTGNEVASTQYLCNGTDGKNGNGMPDLLTRIEIPAANATTSSATPMIIGNLFMFNKADFATDSIVFASDLYTGEGGNFSELELYNLTDDVVVDGSLISASSGWANRKYVVSSNVFKKLPNKQISLGVRFRSSMEGHFASASYTGVYLLIYKK